MCFSQAKHGSADIGYGFLQPGYIARECPDNEVVSGLSRRRRQGQLAVRATSAVSRATLRGTAREREAAGPAAVVPAMSVVNRATERGIAPSPEAANQAVVRAMNAARRVTLHGSAQVRGRKGRRGRMLRVRSAGPYCAGVPQQITDML